MSVGKDQLQNNAVTAAKIEELSEEQKTAFESLFSSEEKEDEPALEQQLS